MNKQTAADATIRVMRLMEQHLLAMDSKTRRMLEEQVAHIIYQEFISHCPRTAVQYQMRILTNTGMTTGWLNIDEETYKEFAVRKGVEVRALAPM